MINDYTFLKTDGTYGIYYIHGIYMHLRYMYVSYLVSLTGQIQDHPDRGRYVDGRRATVLAVHKISVQKMFVRFLQDFKTFIRYVIHLPVTNLIGK